MKLFSYGQSWRRTPVGFLVEAALLSLLLWLPKLLSWDVVRAIELSIVVSAVYLVWTPAAAAWTARVGVGPSINFTFWYFAGSFVLAISLLDIVGTAATDPASLAAAYPIPAAAPPLPSEPPSVMDAIVFSGAAFAVSLVLFQLATLGFPRLRGEAERMRRFPMSSLLPEALMAGFAVAVVPVKGMVLFLDAFFRLVGANISNFAPSRVQVGGNEMQALDFAMDDVNAWLLSLSFGAILFVAHERALTVALSRLYGVGEREPLLRRSRWLRWFVAVPCVFAVLWIYWVIY